MSLVFCDLCNKPVHTDTEKFGTIYSSSTYASKEDALKQGALRYMCFDCAKSGRWRCSCGKCNE